MILPPGFKHDQQLVYGMRDTHPGLLEIMICNPSKKNAIGIVPETKLT